MPVHYSAQPTTTTTTSKKPQQQQQEKVDHRVTKALQDIDKVSTQLDALAAEVEAYSGTRKEKAYLKLEDTLTKKLLELDSVTAGDAPGADVVRTNRKQVVKRVQQLLDLLESKAQ